MKRLIYLLVGWLLLYCGSLNAQQSVTVSTVSSSLVQCGSPQPYQVTIHNAGSSPQSITSIQISLSSCVQYVAGSLSGSGITLGSVNTGLNQLTVSLSNSIPAGGNATLSMQVQAVCGSNCNSSMTHSVQVLYGGNTASSPPEYFTITMPSLSIINVTNQTVTTTVGSTITRCITVQSNGLGAPLSGFTLSVQSDPNNLDDHAFRVSPNGPTISPNANGPTQTLTVGATEISAVGDQDALFESGESITICYDVEVLDCNNLNSSITASWGCGGQTCNSQSVQLTVIVPTVLPLLSSGSVYAENHCYGGGTPSIIKIVLRNTGAGPARDVVVDVWEGDQAVFIYDDLCAFNVGNIQLKHSTGGMVAISAYDTITGPTTPCSITRPQSRFKVKIPFIPGNTTDTLIVERYCCCKNTCPPGVFRPLFYDVHYQNQCSTVNYSIQSLGITGYNIGRVSSFMHFGQPNLDATWQNYSIMHSDFRFFNMDPGGYAIVRFTVPACLQIDAASIYFDYPTLGPNWLPNTVTQPTANTIEAKFRFLSLDGYHPNLEKVELKFRMRADCSAGPCAPSPCGPGPKVVQYQILQVPNPSCTCEALIACYDLTVNTHCGFCPANCPDGGLMFLGFDARRQNYGPSDNNNDGIPDTPNLPNPNAMRWQCLVLNDILTTKFKGVVHTTSANPQWPSGIARSEITDGAYLTPISYTVRIVDHSSGLVHTATSSNIPNPQVPNTNRRRFEFSLNPGNLNFTPALPQGFAYGQDDSIEVVADYRVNYNVSGIEPESIINEFKMLDAGTLEAGCDSYRGDFYLVGYYFSCYGPDVYNVAGCDSVIVSENHYLSVGNCCNNYAGGNLFVNEYRFFARPQSAYLELPPGFACCGVRLDNRRTKGTFGQVYSAFRSVPFAATSLPNGGTRINVDIDSHFLSTAGPNAGIGDTILDSDEGFYGTLRYCLLPSCAVTPNATLLLPHRVDFAPVPAFTGPGSAAPWDTDNDRIVYKAPTLSLSGLTTVSGTASTVQWNFSLTNTSNVASAGNVWFALQTMQGQVIPLQVQANCSTTVNPTGGIYQVGTLAPGAIRNYCITANYGSCNRDSLRIVAGWDCDGYPSSVAAYTCPTVKRMLYVDPAPTELQATITTSSDSMGICDTLDVELTISATQNGFVNGINLGITLPLSGGLTYVPGSTVMSYPASGPWTGVTNPILNANQLNWTIGALNTTLGFTGLPGALQTPSNTFKIRFRVIGNCNMVSGDRIRFVLNGIRTCGAPLPTLTLLSNPINITGASTPYSSTVTSTVTDTLACPMVKRITVTMVNNGPGATLSTDRIVVNFGAGYSYGGGFMGISNAPANTVPIPNTTVGGSSLTWNTPGGVPGGSTISFSFLVNVGNAVACGSDLVAVQALTNQTLYCARTNSNCTTSAVQTGWTSVGVNTTRPNLALDQLSMSLQPMGGPSSHYHYSFRLQNAGMGVLQGATVPVQFYCDVDASCSYTPGDVFLFQRNYAGGIANGAQVIVSDTITVSGIPCPSGSRVVARVDPNFCACGNAVNCTQLLLPVEWESISGEALPDANRITWTATIIPGHDHFVLERAAGNNWVDISAPIYGNQGSYAELDRNPNLLERYRVRAVDQDGRSSHSSIVEIIRDGGGFHPQVYPNPARRSVNLQAPAGTTYKLVSVVGQEVATGTFQGNAPQAVDISDLAAGVYQVEFRLGSNVTRMRLVVE